MKCFLKMMCCAGKAFPKWKYLSRSLRKIQQLAMRILGEEHSGKQNSICRGSDVEVNLAC